MVLSKGLCRMDAGRGRLHGDRNAAAAAFEDFRTISYLGLLPSR